MSRDATGLWSGWARERSVCPVPGCHALPGQPCNQLTLDAPYEHDVHLARTEAYCDTARLVEEALQRSYELSGLEVRLKNLKVNDAIERATRARNLLRDVSVDAGDEMDERITEALSLCCDVVDVLHGGEASTEMSDEEQKTKVAVNYDVSVIRWGERVARAAWDLGRRVGDSFRDYQRILTDAGPLPLMGAYPLGADQARALAEWARQPELEHGISAYGKQFDDAFAVAQEVRTFVELNPERLEAASAKASDGLESAPREEILRQLRDLRGMTLRLARLRADTGLENAGRAAAPAGLDLAVALLTREVICEHAYRNREKLLPPADAATRHDRPPSFEHINRTLGVRSLPLDRIAAHARVEVLYMGKAELRNFAAAVLIDVTQPENAGRHAAPKED